MKKKSFFALLLSPLFFLACGGHHGEHSHGKANEYMHQSKFDDLVKRFESPERQEWQKPDEVIALLGDMRGQTLTDIGCATGYFSLRAAKAGAKVIAADVNQQFLDYLKGKIQEEKLENLPVELRKIPFDSPGLSAGEADKVLMVNVYHHIEERKAYFEKLHQGLKEGGQFIVIDFVKKETPHGPPVEMRISAEQVQEELKTAGFSRFKLNDTLLPYQYILTAYK